MSGYNFSDKADLIAIAQELKTLPEFLEKDIYVSEIIKAISEFKSDKFKVLFCGGTSLLKAHKVINRFSEDIDFKIISLVKNVTRAERRKFRSIFIECINTLENIDIVEDTLLSRNQSKFFQCFATYPKNFVENPSIRPNIKIECTFVDEVFSGVTEKEIKPLIARYIPFGETSIIDCVGIHSIML